MQLVIDALPKRGVVGEGSGDVLKACLREVVVGEAEGYGDSACHLTGYPFAPCSAKYAR
jgi:hypothetical protein